MTASPPPTLSVLIVDDEPLARVRLRDLLADIAAEVPNEVVAEASNGVVAAESLKEHRPDVLLVDIRMPKMDGIEFLRRLRKMSGGAGPKVVFCTTENDLAHIQEALSAGANEYIMKPFDSDIIQTKFQQVGLL